MNYFIKSEIYNALIKINPIVMKKSYWNFLESLARVRFTPDLNLVITLDLFDHEEGRFVYNELVKAGLIEKSGDTYRFSEVLYKLRYTIEKYILKSPKRKLVWTILYAFNKGYDSITVNLLSELLGENEDTIIEQARRIGLRLKNDHIIIEPAKLKKFQDVILDLALKVEWPWIVLHKKIGENGRFFF